MVKWFIELTNMTGERVMVNAAFVVYYFKHGSDKETRVVLGHDPASQFNVKETPEEMTALIRKAQL